MSGVGGGGNYKNRSPFNLGPKLELASSIGSKSASVVGHLGAVGSNPSQANYSVVALDQKTRNSKDRK